jgi:enoyl-CoA hydratase
MDYSKYPGLAVDIDDGIALLTLNQPDTRNAIGRELHRELESVWADLQADPEVNVIVLTGAGKAFSAGGNIKEMVESHGTPQAWKENLEMLGGAKKLIEGILDLSKPLVAAINGDALGLGATIGLLADVIVVSETAKIGDTHVRVGLVAGDGGPVIWPMLLGIARAKEFLMCAKVIDGREAERIGLVNYAVPATDVMAKAMEIARDFNSLAPLAVRWTKVSINKILKERFNLLMDASIAYEILSIASADHGEAGRALMERRAPDYKGC